MLIWQNKPPEAPYEYQEYPKWVGSNVVNSAEEEAALLGESAPSDRTASRAPNKRASSARLDK